MSFSKSMKQIKIYSTKKLFPMEYGPDRHIELLNGKGEGCLKMTVNTPNHVSINDSDMVTMDISTVWPDMYDKGTVSDGIVLSNLLIWAEDEIYGFSVVN